MLGDNPVTVRGKLGNNVQLTITSLCLRLSDLDSGAVIHQVTIVYLAIIAHTLNYSTTLA